VSPHVLSLESLDAVGVLRGESARRPRGTNSRYHAGSMSKPLSRGVHHLALNTDDMKMTLDFYLRVLGMPLVHALKVPAGPGNRPPAPRQPAVREHPPLTSLDAGGDSLLAFFEIPKGAKPRGDRDAIGTMQHVSFAVSEQKFNDVLNRIKKSRIEYLGPGPCRLRNLFDLLPDPNGISPGVLAPEGERAPVVRALAPDQGEALAELRTADRRPGNGWKPWSGTCPSAARLGSALLCLEGHLPP